MATVYRRLNTNASFDAGGAAPYNTPISDDIQPDDAMGGRKLLDQFRDKMRSLHYALATEKAYRHWIIELRRKGDTFQAPNRQHHSTRGRRRSTAAGG